MPIYMFQAYVVYNKYYYLRKSPNFAKETATKNSVFKMSDFLKIHLYSFHILPFLVKGAVNVAIQRNFYGTMPQKFA